MSLAESLNNFRQGIQQTNDYISIAFEVNENGDDLLNDDKKEFVITSAFLRMFICWESFIEEVFSKFLIGEVSTQGTIVDRHVSPVDLNHALTMLIGTQKYVDWANQSIVNRLANIFLKNGKPITSNFNSISTELADLKTIRNAAAHLSSTTRPQLDALASRVLGQTISNTSVAKFVMKMHPQSPGVTILQNYQNILDVAAENIAANRT